MTGSRRTLRNTARAGCVVLASGLGIGALAVASSDAPAGAATELAPFESCAELRAWYVRETLPEVTAWGLEGLPIMLEDNMALRAAAETSDPAVGLGSHDSPDLGSGPTGTNVQEIGVDEPDLAKTQGDHVVSVHGHTLLVTDVSGDEPTIVARLALRDEFYSYELLLANNRVIVLGRGWQSAGIDSRVAFDEVGLSQTSMTTIDITEPSQPVVVGQRTFSGELAAARQHDGTVRLVLSSAEVDLPFVHPGRGRSEKAALQENQALVVGASVDAWLPHHVDSTGRPGGRLVDCDDVRHPRQGSGLGTITVLTIDPAVPGEMESDALTADGSLVYASPEHLYVGTVANGWSGWQEGDQVARSNTTIHAFAIDSSTTRYVASGSVDGVVPDRWALSEYDGMLRVASTRGEFWNPTDTGVTVLAQEGEQLVPVGEVGGMGRHEQITAVRWFGDRAVVVTFRQTDPLYTLDLADPTAPQVTGELKITGFSRYLHPVGPDSVLGIGQSATGSGMTTRSQASSFDLSSASRIDKLDLDASYSPVEDDARAFTYLPELGVALIPLVDYDGGQARLAVVEVRPDGALVARNTIAVPGWGEQTRALPLGDTLAGGAEIAVVADGIVQRIVAIPAADHG